MTVNDLRARSPYFGWAAVVMVAAVADYYGDRTMSDYFRANVKRPVAGPMLAVSWGYLTAHLFGLIPPQYDPLHQAIVHAKAHKEMELCES